MNLSRRGFLQTAVAALVGAAAGYDPLKKLWVPGAKAIEFHKDAFSLVMAPLNMDASAAGSEQLELNDLALRFARSLGERLERHRAKVLQGVLLRTPEKSVGFDPTVVSRKDGISIRMIKEWDGERDTTPRRDIFGPIVTEEWGPGEFAPLQARLIKATDARFGREGFTTNDRHTIDGLSYQMLHDIERQRIDMFAPIGAELRAGVPFSAGVLIGLATDPQTGISARTLRYTPNDGSRMTAFEVAVGHWTDGETLARRRALSAWEKTHVARHVSASDDGFIDEWMDDEGDWHYERLDPLKKEDV